MTKNLSITMSSLPETQEQAIQVAEAFARLAIGLSLDGIQVSISYTTFEPDGSE